MVLFGIQGLGTRVGDNGESHGTCKNEMEAAVKWEFKTIIHFFSDEASGCPRVWGLLKGRLSRDGSLLVFTWFRGNKFVKILRLLSRVVLLSGGVFADISAQVGS